MRKALEFIVNNTYRNELESLFGKDCYISIEKVSWSTNEKKYLVHNKIFIKETDNFEEVYPEGLSFLISESWKFLGQNENFVCLSSFEILD